MAKDGVESHPEILRIQMTDVASISGFMPMKFRQNRVRLFLAGRGMPRACSRPILRIAATATA